MFLIQNCNVFIFIILTIKIVYTDVTKFVNGVDTLNKGFHTVLELFIFCLLCTVDILDGGGSDSNIKRDIFK